ncbi:hypothetical protein ACIQZB_21320 [Streptomyces sp. NPDC097727]
MADQQELFELAPADRAAAEPALCAVPRTGAPGKCVWAEVGPDTGTR